MRSIRFGTDGWRAVIGRDFTEDNVARVARAHAEVLKEKGLRKVFVGYDRRFGSERFARLVAKVMGGEGLEVSLSAGACTTPMVSYAVKYLGFDNGVMITASHNPPDYNGYKIKESFGGSATPEFIKEVEGRIGDSPLSPGFEGEPNLLDVRESYLADVRSRVELELIGDMNLRIVHDPMHGSSAGLIREALSGVRAEVLEIRNWRDVLFGGHAPEPVEKNLSPLKEKVRALGADIGIANDGDGDRVAFVDERGEFVNSQLVYALLLLHLLRNRAVRDGVVVKTVSTTYLADRICRSEGVEIREVPVGFKNINEVILREKVIFGGEESGGYGVPSFLPERDGLLSALLILELMSAAGRSLSACIDSLFKEFGRAYYKRVDLPAEDRVKAFIQELRKDPPEGVGGRKVREAITIDGLKLVFEDDSWLLLRPSGTEPLIRVYAEAPAEEELDEILEGGKNLLGV